MYVAFQLRVLIKHRGWRERIPLNGRLLSIMVLVTMLRLLFLVYLSCVCVNRNQFELCAVLRSTCRLISTQIQVFWLVLDRVRIGREAALALRGFWLRLVRKCWGRRRILISMPPLGMGYKHRVFPRSVVIVMPNWLWRGCFWELLSGDSGRHSPVAGKVKTAIAASGKLWRLGRCTRSSFRVGSRIRILPAKLVDGKHQV